MRRRATAVVLHGGPGLDSAESKESFGFLSDVAQVVCVDHRANGRSDAGDHSRWTLAQWGDDVHSLCEELGIKHPIVIGGSFGGLVAMSYATPHPQAPSALVLVATAAKDPPMETIGEAFRRLAGDGVADIVRRALTHSTPETSELFVRPALPVLSQNPGAPSILAHLLQRTVRRADVELHFTNGELATYDFRDALGKVCCPTLLIGGDHDPVFPPASFIELRDALRSSLVDAHLIERAGHAVRLDTPEEFQRLLTAFIKAHAPS